LAEHLATATGNLISGFSTGCSLAGIGSLSYHCLVDYCLIERHGENFVAYFNIFNHFTSKVVNWNLHFLTFLLLISLLLAARF
jgi:hypothetical protein